MCRAETHRRGMGRDAHQVPGVLRNSLLLGHESLQVEVEVTLRYASQNSNNGPGPKRKDKSAIQSSRALRAGVQQRPGERRIFHSCSEAFATRIRIAKRSGCRGRIRRRGDGEEVWPNRIRRDAHVSQE